MYYFDNAATTKDLYSDHLKDVWGNAESLHLYGQDSSQVLKECRKEIAEYIGAKSPNQIIFTSGGTESNNLAIFGIAPFLKREGKTHIITDLVEHPSVYACMKRLENDGFSVTYLSPNNKGEITPQMVKDVIQDNTGLVSVMHINNETGTMFDIEAIGRICNEKGIFFHSDCVQSFATVPIDVNKFNLDFISVSGHKFHSPKGVGFLYAKNPKLLTPLFFGGKQEFGLRSGTVNVRGIDAMCLAMIDNMKSVETIDKHREYIIKELLENIKGVHINGNPYYSGCRILSIRFDGISGETLMHWLSARHRIAVSTGSACNSGSNNPSRVLLASGLNPKQALSTIRISLSRINTEHDVSILVEKVKQSVSLLRKL